MTFSIYTAGYSGHTSQQLKVAAETLGAYVVDIRYAPYSRVPGWNKAELEALFGDAYRWVSEWGNVNYARESGEIRINNFSRGTLKIKALLKARPIILLCGCADYARCHRKHIADVLNSAGWDVQELAWPETAEGGQVKAISLWQPWASLIAMGAKKVETRGWATSYRGPMVIHAAKTPRELNSCVLPAFWGAFHRAKCWRISAQLEHEFSEQGVQNGFLALPARQKLQWLPLPMGALVAVVDLVDCVPTETLRPQLGLDERAFGNYQPERFGWKLENVRALQTPVPFRGAQGFFNVDKVLLQEVLV